MNCNLAKFFANASFFEEEFGRFLWLTQEYYFLNSFARYFFDFSKNSNNNITLNKHNIFQ